MPRGLGKEGTVTLRALNADEGCSSNGRLLEASGVLCPPHPQPVGSRTPLSGRWMLVLTLPLPWAISSAVFPCLGPGLGFWWEQSFHRGSLLTPGGVQAGQELAGSHPSRGAFWSHVLHQQLLAICSVGRLLHSHSCMHQIC